MAGLAGRHRVRAEKREAVLMTLNRLNTGFPALDAVATPAVGPELPAVQIRMTILALLSDIGEDLLHVTRCARHAQVHTAQRVLGLPVMIELGDYANRTPTGIRVTVLTSDLQISVRTARLRALGGCERAAAYKPGNCYQPACRIFHCVDLCFREL